MDEHKVIELGFRAEALLNSQTFNAIATMLGDGYLNNIAASKPHERQVREDNYHLHRALNDIVSQLAACVAAKNEIAEKLAQKEHEDNE